MKSMTIEPRHMVFSKELILKHSEKRDFKEVNIVLSKIFKEFKHAKKLTGGRVSGVYKINRESGENVIKYSTGLYRMTELRREASVLHYLSKTEVKDSVPKIKLFEIENKHQFAYLVLDYIEGKTVRDILEETKNHNKRLDTWKKVGEALSKIHNVYTKEDTHCEWLKQQLKIAEINMTSNLLDLEEFKEETPIEVLKWLMSNKPKKSKNVIIHGDARTKNIMIDKNNQVKIIDWGFVDIGDAYYDLAVLDYYFSNDLERQSFYKGYSLCQYDKEIIDYYDKLSWFINV